VEWLGVSEVDGGGKEKRKLVAMINYLVEGGERGKKRE